MSKLLEMLSLGQWYEGDLGELLGEAEDAWDAAESNGNWSTTIDVADLTKILKELTYWRAQATAGTNPSPASPGAVQN